MRMGQGVRTGFSTPMQARIIILDMKVGHDL